MPTQAQANPWINMVPIAAVFVIFYFFLIRPQQKQAKEHQRMLEGLKKGDRILTTGGLYGTIVGLKAEDLEVKFAETVKKKDKAEVVEDEWRQGTVEHRLEHALVKGIVDFIEFFYFSAKFSSEY